MRPCYIFIILLMASTVPMYSIPANTYTRIQIMALGKFKQITHVARALFYGNAKTPVLRTPATENLVANIWKLPRIVLGRDRGILLTPGRNGVTIFPSQPPRRTDSILAHRTMGKIQPYPPSPGPPRIYLYPGPR